VFEKPEVVIDLSQDSTETPVETPDGTPIESPFKQIILSGADGTAAITDEIAVEDDAVEETLPVDTLEPVAVVAGEETAEPTPSLEQSVVEAEEAPAAELPTEELVAAPVEIPVEAPPPPSIAAPTISVDSMVANSLGNIFQKKVVKDPIYQALLDRHPNMDMQTLADDLREFSEYIGASEKSEPDTQD
tara:strand:- start:73 stop:639 length:567 start_codon:yes stop_codon:yes gene_type:complete